MYMKLSVFVKTEMTEYVEKKKREKERSTRLILPDVDASLKD